MIIEYICVVSLDKKDSVQSLELSFPVTSTHFHNNKVRLKCLATIAGKNSMYKLYTITQCVSAHWNCYEIYVMPDGSATSAAAKQQQQN